MADGFVVSTSGKVTIIKDPNAVLDYTVDWTAWLAEIADTIATRTIIVPSGIICDSSVITGANLKVTAWLSGGTVGQTYQVTYRITTAGGRTEDRSFFVKIKEK